MISSIEALLDLQVIDKKRLTLKKAREQQYGQVDDARKAAEAAEGAAIAATAEVERLGALVRQYTTDAGRCDTSVAAARDAASRAGLDALLERSAGLLSHGQKRQLEIAMCLATRPQVLLLDEPLAGMGAEETERMLALLAALKAEHAILLVEHDMDAVFRIADRITVMVDGAVIASDTPDAVRRSPEVRAAYLGEHA